MTSSMVRRCWAVTGSESPTPPLFPGSEIDGVDDAMGGDGIISG